MFDLISKHFDLEKRQARSIKKINRRVENDKKKQNAKSHGANEAVSSGKKLQPI